MRRIATSKKAVYCGRTAAPEKFQIALECIRLQAQCPGIYHVKQPVAPKGKVEIRTCDDKSRDFAGAIGGADLIYQFAVRIVMPNDSIAGIGQKNIVFGDGD